MNTYKHIPLLLTSAIIFAACQESLEEKADRDAKDYTRKYCPTPVINHTRTDSVTFNKTKKLYTYHMTFVDELDDKELIDANKDKIEQMLLSGIRESTSMKIYLEAGFKFQYICRSEKNPKDILLNVKN